MAADVEVSGTTFGNLVLYGAVNKLDFTQLVRLFGKITKTKIPQNQ